MRGGEVNVRELPEEIAKILSYRTIAGAGDLEDPAEIWRGGFGDCEVNDEQSMARRMSR